MLKYNPDEWTITKTGAVKLTDEQVLDILITRYRTTHREMADKHGVSNSTVRKIRAGRRRRDLWLQMQDSINLL